MEGVKGFKADAAKAVARNADVPAHWQAAIQAEINAHTSSVVIVDAHFLQQTKKGKGADPNAVTKGNIVLHLTITPIEGFESPSG